MRSVCCPRCGSGDIWKNGLLRNGAQRYTCQNCHKRFRIRNGFAFKMKHSQKIIDFAVFLSNQDDPAFSSRDISAKILEKFCLHVTHVTVAKWIARPPMQLDKGSTSVVFDVPCFSCLLKDSLKSRRCKPENCDELMKWLETS